MSCHIEIDFNDDGTIIMTAKPRKGAEPSQVELSPLGTRPKVVEIAAGLDNSPTHRIALTLLALAQEGAAPEWASWGA